MSIKKGIWKLYINRKTVFSNKLLLVEKVVPEPYWME